MDFHSLTRKELQALCKRNKIPANITNVAMADALKALEIVEGLDEFMNQSQSPEKTMNKSSQDIPSTAARTSTRRKTTEEEPQSTQPTTRTRRLTRRTMELDEENKNVNVPETPVMATTTRRRAQKTETEVEEQKKSDLLETPALQSGRRRPGVGSTRRKVEAQKEGSLQQGYGTRRSVRLLEKCMTGLSLKESERMEPVKIDEMLEDEVEENKNGQFEAPAEVPLARNLIVSLQDERDLKDNVLENSKCYHSGGNDCTVISEAGSHKSDNLDTKDASLDKSDAYLANLAKSADSDGTIDTKGSDDSALSEDSHENDNSNEESIAENNGGSHTDETRSINALVADAFEELSEEALDNSSSAEFMEQIEVVSVEEYAANHAALDVERQKLVGKDCDCNVVVLNDDLAKLPQAEEYDGCKVSQNVSALPEGQMDSSEKMGNEESEDDPDQIDDDTRFDNNSLADELQEEISCEQKCISIPTAAYSSEDPMINMVNGEELVDVNVAEAEIIHVVESSFHNAPRCVVGDIPIHKMLDNGDAEALVDICVNPVEEFEETTQEIPPEEKSPTAAKLMSPCPPLTSNCAITTSIRVVGDNPIHKMLDYGDAEAMVDICVNPAEEFEEATQEIPPEEKSPSAAKLMSPCPPLASNCAITTSIPLSPLTAQFSHPSSFTPRKSSSMKQTTIPKVIQVSDNNNKENIDNNSVKEVVPNLGKVKESKNIIDEETMQKLDGMSLRNLKKLTKKFDKLQIIDNMKKNEDKNDSKPLGKTRPALQTLPQNCMSTGEVEKQN
ncbi:uncharacterized protein LOC111296876 [Durio zibethinus]|uniref:Uncharacterized protein LOC111296876 n=1 Tax=Durio zibethinus TaxID=66656 RepID=A0A6P5Z3E1_DURZI|nr:uncharacterized protein LOC111296876 [Durio zibethinus]